MLNVIVVDPNESTAENVARMRATAKAAAENYHQVKVQALNGVGRALSANGGLFTARQIAEATGLTSGEVAAQFGYNGRFKAATDAGLCGHVHSEAHRITRRFVEVDVCGNIIDDRIHERHQTIVVYGASGVDGITCNR